VQGAAAAELNIQNPSYGPSRPEPNPHVSYPSTASLEAWKAKEPYSDLSNRLVRLLQQTCDELKDEINGIKRGMREMTNEMHEMRNGMEEMQSEMQKLRRQ
jgi:hypothetical protein